MFVASKVIIRGRVFDYADKAPFVVSGQSVLGALEYDPVAGKIKCHECGEWQLMLNTSHTQSHGISQEIYKVKHGLNLKTRLVSPETSARFRNSVSVNRMDASKRILAEGRKKGYTPGPREKVRHGAMERQNVNGYCKVQTLFRLQMMAADKGQTPTGREIVEGKLFSPIIRHFGSYRAALEAAGLVFRKPGSDSRRKGFDTPLPAGFPSKEKLEESRMPWPKEYFGTRPLEQRSILKAS